MIRESESFECYLYSVLQGLPDNSFSIISKFTCVFACVKVEQNFKEMFCLMLSLTTFMVGLQGVFSGFIPRYEIAAEESIKSNLIGYKSDLAEDLTPPVLEAKNYFSLQSAKTLPDSENPYVVEIHRKYLAIKTTGLLAQKIKLNQTESERIQKLSWSFVELLNSSKLSSQAFESEVKTPEWRDLNPVIILSNSGISLQFFNVSSAESDATDISSENRRILWDFLTKYARNIFEEKLKQLKISEKYAEVFDSAVNQTDSFAFQNFINFLWSIMRLSVDYAETAFEGWTTSERGIIKPEMGRKIPSTTVTLFAYEEPSPFHEFPAQEFQYRRKDIDSIFYGRGVI